MVLLVGTAALAQPQGAKRWRRVERSVSVSAGTSESVQRLRLAPHVVTTVLFDSDVVLEAAAPEAVRGLFTRLELETDHLVLKPAVAIPEKGVPPLVERFADGAAPVRLVLELTTEADEVDAVVEVRRQPASVEQLEAELVALRGQCAALEARLAAARRTVPQEGLAAAILSGAIKHRNVVWKWVDIRAADQRLRALKLDAYRSGEWMAVALELENPRGEEVWVPGLARLTRLDANGRHTGEVHEAPVLMAEARLKPGQSTRAVVEWRTRVDESSAPWALEVLDAGGRLSLRWSRVEL
ncbi:DUF2381 family protein [Pyxidicoccus xibeiensis]|uniref:DUF2381 family protein n=1 Tax=Pyxidicoccus xibeiensis TaxID=2906759 RepID=UPI0020A81736|nr:DUF2381 family protein [Pyxidicoccus xibeiensis]MCP3142994.1 DUF2381 family protein [Pyxidicoccus xibeiensis]